MSESGDADLRTEHEVGLEFGLWESSSGYLLPTEDRVRLARHWDRLPEPERRTQAAEFLTRTIVDIVEGGTATFDVDVADPDDRRKVMALASEEMRKSKTVFAGPLCSPALLCSILDSNQISLVVFAGQAKIAEVCDSVVESVFLWLLPAERARIEKRLTEMGRSQ